MFMHSATQDKLPVEVDKTCRSTSCSTSSFETLEPGPVLKTLEKLLRHTKVDTRLKAAVRATVTLREQNGGKQLDQGYFSRPLPIRMEGFRDLEPPLVTALSRGDVEIGVGEELGRVVFRPFLSREGERSRRCRSGRRARSSWSSRKEKTVPPYIEAKLTRDKKGSADGRHKWNLEVTLPPGSLEGTLPEDAVIILRMETQPQPRRIRIPVIATGGRG